MNTKDWFIIGTVITTYVLFGGLVFMFLEKHTEIKRNQEISTLRKDVKDTLLHLDLDFYASTTSPAVIDALIHAKEAVLDRISDACNIENLHSDNNLFAAAPEEYISWNFYNSVFFAFTVITAIGYGFMTPTTNLGKIFLMIYALIGIPLSTILLTSIGDYFSSRLINLRQKSKEKKTRNRCTFVLEVLFYLIPGILVFFIIPSGIFVLIEGWTFMDALYFAFVSLTTIGFGDFVAGIGSGNTLWMWLYKLGLIMWIIFGLGYFIMILGFISRGMKSKKVQVAIQKPLSSILNTKEKLAKDIGELKKVVNEIYLMKVEEEEMNQELNMIHTSSIKQDTSFTGISSRPLSRNVSGASWSRIAEEIGTAPSRKITGSSIASWSQVAEEIGTAPSRKITGSSIASGLSIFPDLFSRRATPASLSDQASVIHFLSRDVLNCLKQTVEGLDAVENELEELKETESADIQELGVGLKRRRLRTYDEIKGQGCLVPRENSNANNSSILNKVAGTIRKISSGSWRSSSESYPSRPITPLKHPSRKNSPSPFKLLTPEVSKGPLSKKEECKSESVKVMMRRNNRSDTNLLKTEAQGKMRRNVSFQGDLMEHESSAHSYPDGLKDSIPMSQLIGEEGPIDSATADVLGDTSGLENLPANRRSNNYQRRRKYGIAFQPNLARLSLCEELELQEFTQDVLNK